MWVCPSFLVFRGRAVVSTGLGKGVVRLLGGWGIMWRQETKRTPSLDSKFSSDLLQKSLQDADSVMFLTRRGPSSCSCRPCYFFIAQHIACWLGILFTYWSLLTRQWPSWGQNQGISHPGALGTLRDPRPGPFCLPLPSQASFALSPLKTQGLDENPASGHLLHAPLSQPTFSPFARLLSLRSWCRDKKMLLGVLSLLFKI